MFIDEISVRVKAGQGGNGSVHFSVRKYQAFGGPDGGDGGKGGDVVLVGSRNVESLSHLRSMKLVAQAGMPGDENLMIGARAENLEVPVPLGTLVIGERFEEELGTVTPGSRRFVAALGGRGGKGNTHYATGGRRAPKLAEEGRYGQELDLLLNYRIYADTILLEAQMEHHSQLLPTLLERSYGEVNWALFNAAPRWVRIKHDFNRYDVAYIPFDLADEDAISAPLLAHTYWADTLVINMLPLEELAGECWPSMESALQVLELRRCKRIVVLAEDELFAPWSRTTLEGKAEVICQMTAGSDSMAAFAAQLTGGIIS